MEQSKRFLMFQTFMSRCSWFGEFMRLSCRARWESTANGREWEYKTNKVWAVKAYQQQRRESQKEEKNSNVKVFQLSRFFFSAILFPALHFFCWFRCCRCCFLFPVLSFLVSSLLTHKASPKLILTRTFNLLESSPSGDSLSFSISLLSYISSTETLDSETIFHWEEESEWEKQKERWNEKDRVVEKKSFWRSF